MVNTDDCWLYAGTINSKGYTRLRKYHNGTHFNYSVHRLTYEQFNGVIPDGYEVDHLCRVRHCVNPDHLEAVTKYENNRRSESFSAINARKTHCPYGHEYAGHNVIRKNGARYCRECEKERSRRYYQLNKHKWARYNNK